MFFLGLSAMAQTPNPLRVSTTNPRYFTDNSGKAIFLTGSNWGQELQDDSWSVPNTFKFDNSVPVSGISYLDFLAAENHNYIRILMAEHSRFELPALPDVTAHPMIYVRNPSSPPAKDSLPQFTVQGDGSEFSSDYFNRLHDRALAAASLTPSRTTPIYTGVMLFQGDSITNTIPVNVSGWFGHPYNVENNTTGVNGDPGGLPGRGWGF
jgi:hypothetical protein